MLFVFGTLLGLGAIFEICYSLRANVFKSKRCALLAAMQNCNSYTDYESLTSLPKPVVAYLKMASPEYWPVINLVHLGHTGRFKKSLNGSWNNITGEEYFVASPPGFLWQGKTDTFTAFDLFIKERGEFSVWLFSAFRLFQKKGAAIDEAELMRWVGESVLFPSSLYPSSSVRWKPLDTHDKALLMYSYFNFSFSFTVSFNSHNEIISMETKRYMGNQKETWIGTFANYKTFKGYRIPTVLEASWVLKDVKHTYAKFEIKDINIELATKE